MTLTTQQRQHFRALAHPLKPVVIIGSNGLTAAVQTEINRALDDHELIKVRINANTREDRTQLLAEICAQQTAQSIQLIGHIGIIYRKRQEQVK